MSTEEKVSFNKMITSESIKNTLDSVLKGYNMKSIECPKYLLPVVGLDEGDIFRCFVSMHEPEKIVAALAKELSSIADEDMGWRKDIGVWSSTYRMRNSTRTFGMDISAPGLSEMTRNDPAVRKYKSILDYSISAPAKK